MRTASMIALTFIALPLMAGDQVKSGLQPGAATPAFDVVDITGKFKSRAKVCYI